MYNVTNTTSDFDLSVQTVYSFANAPNITLVDNCIPNKLCKNNTWRTPIIPLNRGFPVLYEFDVFDPGNDDVTVTLDMGSSLFNATLNKPVSGQINGTLTI